MTNDPRHEKPAKAPVVKPTRKDVGKKFNELPREQIETELEQRPYLDTEGGE